MRYLYLLFFFFLSLHSYFVFAQDEGSHTFPASCAENFPMASCFNWSGAFPETKEYYNNQCTQSGTVSGGLSFAGSSCTATNRVDITCNRQCTCPEHEFITQSGNQCTLTCPTGKKPNTVINNGTPSYSCVDDEPTDVPPDECVPLMPCDNECPAGQTKQGEINGAAVCIGSCSDPNTSWGVVNGVEGCHGPGTDPTCPNGGAYGYVNGVPGCYGGGSGDGSGDGSGSGGSSSGGGDGSGDGSGGAGGSSGSGSGSDGDGGGGSPGGGGSGSGSNNDMGSAYDEAEPCPVGMIKSGNKCVSDGRGDCIAGYHELVISRDPYLFICVADDPPPSSSSPSASSQPSSQASSSPSSQSASAASASAASGGATGSSGSGTGSGGGGTGDSGAGDCDPTAADYFKCAGMLEELSGDDLESINQSIDDTNTKSLQDYEKLLKDDLDDFEREGVFFADEPSLLKNLLQSFLPVSSACNPPAFNILGRSHTLDCTYFDTFKAAFGWFLAVLTAFQIWQLAIRPVER